MNNTPVPPKASGAEYAGPFGFFPVPYSEAVFNFHWFNFYNAICFQIILGAPAVLLAKDLGASSVILGVIAAFTPLMTVLQLPAARYLGNHSYRSFALSGWALRSLFIAVAAVVPLLFFLSKEVRLGLLLGSLFFFNLLRGVATAAFMPWVSSLVGSGIRGRFLSIDQTFIYAGSLVTMLLASLLMRGRVDPLRYSLVFGVSVAGAVVSLLYMRLIPDAQQKKGEEGPSRHVSWREMALLRPFRNWILVALLFVTVGGGLGVFSVEYLKVQAHFSPSVIYLLSIGTFAGPMLVLQRVGRRVDRIGSLFFIRGALFLFSVILLFWFAMSAGVIPHDWKMVLFLNLLGGSAMAIYNLANGHLLMAAVPESGKNHYFAVATVITSVGLGIVPILWGWLLDALGGLDVMAGPFHLRRHSIYFLGIFLLAVASLLASRILVDPGKSAR